MWKHAHLFAKETYSRGGFAVECEAVEKKKDRIHFIIVMIRWTGLAPWERTWYFSTSSSPSPSSSEAPLSYMRLSNTRHILVLTVLYALLPVLYELWSVLYALLTVLYAPLTVLYADLVLLDVVLPLPLLLRRPAPRNGVSIPVGNRPADRHSPVLQGSGFRL